LGYRARDASSLPRDGEEFRRFGCARCNEDFDVDGGVFDDKADGDEDVDVHDFVRRLPEPPTLLPEDEELRCRRV